MKVAIYHNLPSGGGKRALYEMTHRLGRRHEVDVYTLSTADHVFCDLRPFCSKHVVFPFNPLPLTSRPFGRLNQGIRSLDLLRLNVVQREIAAEIDDANYDVVFVHGCQFGQSPGLLRFLQSKSVYYCQEPPRQIYEPRVERPYDRYSTAQKLGNLVDPLPFLYRKTLATLDRRRVQAADLVLVNSAYSRESLYRSYGLFAQVCYLGVDTECFRPLALPREDFVLSVGALNPRKGFDFLIRSLAQLPEMKRPCLIIVSNFVDETEREYLEILAAPLKVMLEFKTMIGDGDLVRLYNQARMVLYAPIMEPFGFVPLEAMACGTPVIGVREGGVRESIIDGVTSVLVDRDTTLFSKAIERLLDDDSLINEFGKQSIADVRENWTWDKSIDGLERALCDTAQLTKQVSI